ncbi:MAG TPA: response regulator [Thermoanaerobaculia bacterium]|jgi:signal transduction histidine kinase/CheY-like chemotaxis protein|nr:response regulator [Thermoanaerobaculia bacterium]
MPSDRESVLRFDLAVQKSHALVYTAAILTVLAAHALGVFALNMKVSIAVVLLFLLCSVVMYTLFRRGIDRRILNPIWIATDIVLVTLVVYATGGAASPWFIWYLTTAASTAFAVGKRASYLVSAVNVVAYIAVLVVMGQTTFVNDVMLLAFTRMLFLSGASFFFLAGIANLQQKRLLIRELKNEKARELAELTRLTEELQARGKELEEASRRLQEADRLKSQFLANMSHELRTPMNSIIGFSEILIERLSNTLEPKHVGFLRHILTSGQHLLGIINDILDLSKIEAGKMEIYAETFPVRPVIESVCLVMRGMARTTMPSFIIEADPNLPPIETDLAKFKQILYNLLSNAMKFAPPEAPISISVIHLGDTPDDGTITISVRDQGIGIEPENHDVIFEEFRQIDGTARREFGGTGLGLALVKKFVQLQGGWVRVDSAPGKGSTFSFSLPVHSRAAVVNRTPEIVPAGQPSERVLVVEDDAHAYELISTALSSAGYVSVRARHGDEAIRLARETRPIAITLDLVLPGVDGWEVLKTLKSDAATRDIPVVIISRVDERDLGVALGADDYFVKPVDRDRLLDRVRQLTASGESKTRLLLIDDDPSVHELLGEDLTPLGYTIESAFNGESGVAAAKKNAPDVIILDLMMPGMSGFEVAGMLKDNPSTAHIPILVLTSKEISPDDRRELQSKVAACVQKGTSARDQLVAEIRRLRRPL